MDDGKVGELVEGWKGRCLGRSRQVGGSLLCSQTGKGQNGRGGRGKCPCHVLDMYR